MKDTKDKLGLFMLIALVTGNMVGSGAFLLPADLARIGSISLLALIFTVIGALCLALVFAKMSLLVPKNGGPYVYANEGFGEYMGLQTAYYYWIAVWVGNSALVVAAIGYLDVFFPVVNNPLAKTISILTIIWTPTIVNMLGVRVAGFVQIITSILKFAPLLIIGIMGWWYFHPEYLTEHFNVTTQSNFSSFSSAIVLTLWLFVGVESAAVPNDSVHNPKRNIPLATLIGTAIAAIVYILSYTAIFGMLPNDLLAHSTYPFATAAEIILGSWGKLFVAFGAVVACLGALNGWTLVAAQIPMAAAHDGLFPKIFAKCNRHKIPAFGLLITSLCISTLVLSSTYLNIIDQFNILILAATTATVVAYFYTAIAQIIILPKQPLDRKNLFHICVAILAAAYSFCAILGSSKEVIFYFTAFILLTIPFYAIFCRYRKNVQTSVSH